MIDHLRIINGYNLIGHTVQNPVHQRLQIYTSIHNATRVSAVMPETMSMSVKLLLRACLTTGA